MSISSAKGQLKNQLRQQMKDRLSANQKRIDISTASKMGSLLESRTRAHLLIYASLPTEFPTREIFEFLRTKKVIYFPRCEGNEIHFHRISQWDELQKGRWSLEPPPSSAPWTASQTDTTVMLPGLAFSKGGERLGRGKGFYDRFLEQYAHLHRLGLAYPFQIVNEIPSEPHDQKVHEILCSQGLWICHPHVL